MAKINGVLIPKASGSIGNITFRSSGRNTVASEKIVKNTSRTAAQVEQRLRFKERMEIAVHCKESAPFMYKKKGFRSAFAELSSRVMSLKEVEYQMLTRTGYLNLLRMDEELNLPIVQGEVSATNVSVDSTQHKIIITAPLASFEPRKDGTYGITQAAVVTSSEDATTGDVTIYPLDTEEIGVSIEGHLLIVTMSINNWPWNTENKGNPIPSVNVNGKRIGYGMSEYTIISA